MTKFNSSCTSSTKSYSLQIISCIPELRERRREELLSRRSVGLVPTLGALHTGHLALIRQAATENDSVYVSIYVNPTQFGVNEDLKNYPRTFDADIEKLEILNEELKDNGQKGQIKAVFAPATETMYPTLPPTSELDGHGSFVNISPIDKLLEGASRPVFFRGVATVCMKLFNIVQPESAYFGQKDIQQTMLLNRMIKDLHINTQMRVCPTLREQDGLAMSSRNVYLGQRRRHVATTLFKALKAAEEAYVKGSRDRDSLLSAANEVALSTQDLQHKLDPCHRAFFEVDYISLADPDSMKECRLVDPRKGAILCGALKMLPLEDIKDGEDSGLGGGTGTVRLIDNLLLEPEKVLLNMP